MLTFHYSARDSHTGELVKSQVEADSEQSAAKLIRAEGLSPIEITLGTTGSSFLSGYRNKVKTKDRILFARQLSTLINAGLPLVQSLRSVADQTQSKPLKVVINKIISDVEAGSNFSAALSSRGPLVQPVPQGRPVPRDRKVCRDCWARPGRKDFKD